MKLPNRNYLAMQNLNLILAGDRLASAIQNVLLCRTGNLPVEAFASELRLASQNWDQVKKNLMDLAGMK
jgi:hypothetical protein